VGATLTVEVVFALPLAQDCSVVELSDGASVRDAIMRSGVTARHPEIDLGACRVGVWGRRVPVDHPLRDGDRVEIYRPLQADPKEARRARTRRRKV
jgi:putative ubiquitin-RnfH superfamily antitoxin RatB of RatAB toxin-antitoxin module